MKISNVPIITVWPSKSKISGSLEKILLTPDNEKNQEQIFHLQDAIFFHIHADICIHVFAERFE